MKKGLLLAFASIGFLTSVFASESTVGRNVSTSYGMDTVDHYSGAVKFNTPDYQILIGQNSHFPLNRETKLDGTSMQRGVGRYGGYNFSQAIDNFSMDVCPTGKNIRRFKSPNGQVIVFHHTNKVENTTDNFLSKSNWLLDCSPDKSEFEMQLISPYGMSFYFDKQSSIPNYPVIISDANKNEMNLVYSSYSDLVITTKYQTINISSQDIRVSGYSEPVVKFNEIHQGYSVSYFGDSSWTFQSSGNGTSTVCNPLKACGTYKFEAVTLNGASSKRLVKKDYDIALFGEYSVAYEYSDGSNINSTVVSYPDHKREYVFHHIDGNSNKERLWKNGLPKLETVWNSAKSEKYQQIVYTHTPSKVTLLDDELTYLVKGLNSGKETKRWAKNSVNNLIWVGTVVSEHSDFNKYSQPEKTTYSYPAQVGSDLYPSITYVTKYDQTKPIHRVDLVSEIYIEGLLEKTSNEYDDRGNRLSTTVNGITTVYTYNDFGELTSITDPKLNVSTFLDFEFGIPTNETGPEGFTAIRTVENGFIKTETTWGDRTVVYTYDPFGKLVEYQPADENRLPIRYALEYPAEGGLKLVEMNGTLTKISFLNGFGQPYKITTQGLSTGTGSSYRYKNEFEYFYDGSVKSESATVDENTHVTEAHRTTYTQDPTGRRYELDPSDGPAIKFTYPEPFTTQMIDSSGVVTVEKYRPFSGFGSEQLVSRVHPPGNTSPTAELKVEIDYLDNGKLDTVKVDGVSQYYNYNPEGFLKSYSTPETGLVQYAYDQNGNLIWEKHNEDSPTVYEYDKLDRLVKKVYSNPSLNVDYSFNDFTRVNTVEKSAFGWRYELTKDGNVTKAQLIHDHNLVVPATVNTYPNYTYHTGRADSAASESSGVTGRSGQSRYNYQNSVNNPISHSSNAISSSGFLDWTFEYQYDSQGFLSLVKYPDGEEIGYVVNSLGQPTQAGSYVSNVVYWPNGAIRSLTYGNGLVSQFEQNTVTGKLNGIKHGGIWHKKYGYQSSSYVNSIQDLLDDSKSISMDYDQLYQLKNVKSGLTDSILESFSYTPTGDLKTKSSFGETITYAYSQTSNRLESVNIDGQRKILGYTADGRVTMFGENDYGYTEDKLLTKYSLPNSDEYSYLYDGNGKKVKTLINGKLDKFTIYDHTGRLIYEESPGDVTSNLVYLDNRLVAKRDGLYNIGYTECDYIEDADNFETKLLHRPVYMHKQTNEPVAYGDCELYSRWDHDFKSNSGVWSTRNNKQKDYYVWVNQYSTSDTSRLTNKGSLYEWLYKKAVSSQNGSPIRKYVKSNTRRWYKCYMPYKIVKYTYDLKSEKYTNVIIASGSYYTGRYKKWSMFGSKPRSFSCSGEKIDYNKIPWPSMSGH